MMTQQKNVQPIRDQQQLEDMKWALKRHCSERDYILFVLGCETGLRVGDLLKLTTKQILTLKQTKQDSSGQGRQNAKNPRHVYRELL